MSSGLFLATAREQVPPGYARSPLGVILPTLPRRR
jgi:hypothetical protein